jgi:hypothetical protein
MTMKKHSALLPKQRSYFTVSSKTIQFCFSASRAARLRRAYGWRLLHELLQCPTVPHQQPQSERPE